MTTILVDSNVHLDLITEDSVWFSWSSDAIERYMDTATLAINPIIYAEISTRFGSIEELEAALPRTAITRLDLPWEAAFLAAKCFVEYRRRGGLLRSPMPDFYIGAHAAVSGLTLLTRDATRYRTYFPALKIIAPN